MELGMTHIRQLFVERERVQHIFRCSISAMLLARCFTRRTLGVLRPSYFRVVNADCNGVVAVLVLNREAGGVPGKRRKYRGDYKVSQATATAAVAAASMLSLLWQLRVVAIPLFPLYRHHCVASRLDVLHSMAERRRSKV